MAYLHGKFMWFEHFSNDVPKARAFYAALFGWKTDPVPMGAEPYPLIQNAGQGIGGFRTAPPGVPDSWMSYLSVPDVDAAVKSAQAAGAKVFMPPTDFPSVGRGATPADPTGAVFSVWKGTGDDPPDTHLVPPGAWYWDECWTPQRDAALEFYEKAFGFTHDTMLSRTGPYYLLMKHGLARGGIMQSDQPGTPATWLPYVSVSDCDAIAKRAAELGAKVGVPPMDIPDVGRMTMIMDTTGTVIGAIKGKNTG